MDFVRADSLYGESRDQKDIHTEHDMFRSNEMENKDKVSGEVRKPRVHGHLFCSALKTALCCKAPASKNGEVSRYQGRFWQDRI